MALEVSNSGIGRMFAQRNLFDVYTRQPGQAVKEAESAVATVDTVVLSANVPQPFSARAMEEAMDAARALNGNAKLTSDQQDIIREDRVFAAVSLLLAIGTDGNTALPGWPGGLPAPTDTEMREVHRRLSQRLRDLDLAKNAESANNSRAEVLETIRKTGFEKISSLVGG